MARSLYVHIPFCVRRCIYCDFVTGLYNRRTAAVYVESLKEEIRRLPVNGPLETLYIGGGTPTVLPLDMLLILIDTVTGHFGLEGDAEASIEANPGTMDREKLAALRKAGLNRISIGIQSFNDTELALLGRIHSSAEAVRAVENARKAGFDNVGIDLIYGIPGQHPDDWDMSLEQAIRLKPQHISTYELTVEKGTPLSEMLIARKSPKPLPDEETIVNMYYHATDYLKSEGYRHYEISNFAFPSHECRHNINYWNRGEYIGAGLGAHSLVSGCRIRNSASMDRYFQIQKGNKIQEMEKLLPGQAISEAIFLGMRKTGGICLEDFSERYRVNIMHRYKKEIEYLVGAGLIETANRESSCHTCLRLTRKGLVLSNEVFGKFI